MGSPIDASLWRAASGYEGQEPQEKGALIEGVSEGVFAAPLACVGADITLVHCDVPYGRVFIFQGRSRGGGARGGKDPCIKASHAHAADTGLSMFV